jgi:hypothetical protein
MRKHGIKLSPHFPRPTSDGVECDLNSRIPWYKNVPKMELVDLIATVGIALYHTRSLAWYPFTRKAWPQVTYLSEAQRKALAPHVAAQAARIHRKERRGAL